MKKHNFYAGPSILSQYTIKNTAEAVLDFAGTGLSILEISHRSKEFQAVIDEASALVKELLEILVQTTIDFINERGLTDIYSVGFGADDLQGSAKFGEWEPCTDASIHVTGLGKEKGKDGHEYSVCQNIGSYM